MKNHLNTFVLLFLICSVYSCKKQDFSKPKSNQETKNLIISNLQKSLQSQMDATKYSNLDWSRVSIQSLDADYPNVLVRVQDKTNLQKALYYSKMDNVESFHFVTINLPQKATSSKDVNGNIEVRSGNDILLKKLIVRNNKIFHIEQYDKVNNSFSKDHVNDNNISQIGNGCEGCTLPEVTVTCYVSTTNSYISFYSLLYTYGAAGSVTFTQTQPVQYGSGGKYSSPYWDRYASQSNGGGTLFINSFLDTNPNYQDSKFAPVISHTSNYDIWKVTDNKTFTFFNVSITFEIDKLKKLIPNQFEVKFQGVLPRSYEVDNIQTPSAQYGTDGSMSFTIQGYWSYGLGHLYVPISVFVDNINSITPKVSIEYGVF